MDQRSFLDRLREEGLLQVIDQEVDWNLQAGALSSMSNRVGGPALHLTRVKGYKGTSLAGGLYTGPSNLCFKPEKPWSRQAVALEMDSTIGYEDFMGQLMERSRNTIPPMRVTTGPCKENILLGDEADITRLPIPFLHQGDGGRYGTCSTVIVRDPRSGGMQSWTHARWMVVDGQTLAVSIPPMKALGPLLHAYEAAGKPMPFCIVLGGDPAGLIASAAIVMPGAAEVDLAGGLRRDSMALVRAETNDLLVPSEAEVIIEGEVRPGDRVDEGPFPEWVRRSKPTPQPAFRIKAITHRNNPVIPFSAEGGKYSDTLSLTSTLVSLGIRGALAGLGYPVRWVNCPVETVMALCVVSLKMMRSGWANNISCALFALPFGKWFDKVIVLEDDVEAIDWPQILKDWAQKVYPGRGVNFTTGSPGFLVDYSNSDAKNDPVATKVFFDATIPYWWDKGWVPKRVSFETSYPPEIQQRVIEQWKDMGLPGEPPVKRKYI